MSKDELSDRVDVTNIQPEYSDIKIIEKYSEYELVELKLIYDTLGKIPITLDGDSMQNLINLRNKIKHDFDLKQKNINK